MAVITDVPKGPRAMRRPQSGNRALRWLRANLFSSIPNGIITLVLLTVLAKGVISFVQWGIANAVWLTPANDSSACRAVRGLGACFAVIPEKYRFILFGTYPFEEQWRPALAVLLFIAIGGAWAMGYFRTDPAVAELQQMRDQMFANLTKSVEPPNHSSLAPTSRWPLA